MKKLIFITIAFVFLLTGFFALARETEVTYPDIPGAESPQDFLGSVEENQAFPLFLKYFYHFIVYSSGLVCLGVMIYGGVGYMLSFGSAIKMKQGLDRVTVGFIGVIIILSSFTMAKTIDPNLVTFDLEKVDVPEIPEIKVPDLIGSEFVFYKIPLGGLIDQVVEKAETADEKADSLSKEAKVLQGYDSCLKDISDQCKCGNLKGECESGGWPPGDFCYQGKCEGDPCDKIINPFMCKSYGIPVVMANPSRARQGIEIMSEKITQQETIVNQKKLEASIAKSKLDFANQRLKLAESLLRVASGLVINHDSYISIKNATTKKLWLYEDFDLEVDGRKITQDPADLYIQEQGNKQLVDEIQALLAAPPPFSSPHCDNYDKPAAIPDISEELKQFALNAEEKTGVRASLILALLQHESGLQQFPGTGSYPNDFCCTVSHWWQAHNCNNFESIWGEVGSMYPYSLNTVPVSATRPIAGVYNCGGAMGPGQAMPFMWMELKSQVQSLTGKSTVSPFEFEDAFIFSALHLVQKGGADSQQCDDEIQAMYRYWGSSTYTQFACSIMNVANAIADANGWDTCERPSIKPPTPGEWSVPIRDHYSITDRFQVHVNAGRSGGIDLAAPAGTSVYPTKEGTVIFAKDGWNYGYGTLVKVEHDNGYVSMYSHFVYGSIEVKQGQKVDKNTRLGSVDTTGNSTGNHLHFEIRENGWRPVDPELFMGF